MEPLEAKVSAIEERNRKVEADKAWELSFTRRVFIALCTYITACIFLWWINSGPYLLQALVPTGGYLLSTLSLPWLKARWIRKR